MNFTNLNYFQTVAEEMSFTKAARRLYISQQSLSSHIARLEEECGTMLFERSPKLKLTYAGECVLEHANKILALGAQMNNQLSDIANQRSGKLSLGVYQHRSQVFLSKTLPQYIRLFPNTKLHLETNLSKALEERLLQGGLDLIVGFTPFHNKELETIHIVTERLCILVPREMFDATFVNSRAAAAHFTEKGADINALAHLPFLFLEPDNRARVLADRIFANAHKAPNILLQTADTPTLLSLCRGGMGATFVFEQAAKEMLGSAGRGRHPEVYVFPVLEEGAVAELVVAHHKSRYLSNSAKNFIAIASEVFDSSYSHR